MILFIFALFYLVASAWRFEESKYITFKVYYPYERVPNNTIFMRGTSCNLTMDQGIPLKKYDHDLWMTALLCP